MLIKNEAKLIDNVTGCLIDAQLPIGIPLKP